MLAEWPSEHFRAFDREVSVFFTYPHPARFWAEGAAIYHLPSLSRVDLNWQGEVVGRDHRSDEGQRRLDELLANETAMERVRSLIPWDSRAA